MATKQDAILKFIERAQGATIAQLQKVTGWQPHSIRAALTGLRKKKYDIGRDKNSKGVNVYRIVQSVPR